MFEIYLTGYLHVVSLLHGLVLTKKRFVLSSYKSFSTTFNRTIISHVNFQATLHSSLAWYCKRV